MFVAKVLIFHSTFAKYCSLLSISLQLSLSLLFSGQSADASAAAAAAAEKRRIFRYGRGGR